MMTANQLQKILQQIQQMRQQLLQLTHLPLALPGQVGQPQDRRFHTGECQANEAGAQVTWAEAVQQAAAPLLTLEALLESAGAGESQAKAGPFEVGPLEADPVEADPADPLAAGPWAEPQNSSKEPPIALVEETHFSETCREANPEQMAAALRQSEARFRSTSEQSAVGICHCDFKGHFLWVNPALCQLLGYSQEELLALTFQDITHPADRPQQGEQALLGLSPSDPACSLEKRYLRKNGELLWSHVTISVVRDEANNICYLTGIVQDITAQKQMEMELRESLQEKELLLAEVHHRVNNNLQIISSLLELQAKRVQDTAARSALTAGQNRVMAMALVHEILYQSGNLAKIDFGQYAQRLLHGLLRIYEGDVALMPELNIATALPVSGELAIVLGLILNELVTNALKHGLLQQPMGTLMVNLSSSRPNCYRLAVSHSGDGLPADFSLDLSNSMGLKLVRLLAQRIHGHLEVERGQQTTFTVQFSVNPNGSQSASADSARAFSNAMD